MPTNHPVLTIGLLEQDYQVCGTLRSMDREDELRNMLAKFVQ